MSCHRCANPWTVQFGKKYFCQAHAEEGWTEFTHASDYGRKDPRDYDYRNEREREHKTYSSRYKQKRQPDCKTEHTSMREQYHAYLREHCDDAKNKPPREPQCPCSPMETRFISVYSACFSQPLQREGAHFVYRGRMFSLFITLETTQSYFFDMDAVHTGKKCSIANKQDPTFLYMLSEYIQSRVPVYFCQYNVGSFRGKDGLVSSATSDKIRDDIVVKNLTFYLDKRMKEEIPYSKSWKILYFFYDGASISSYYTYAVRVGWDHYCLPYVYAGK